MKFMQALNPTDPNYTELLAQKAAHAVAFPQKEEEKENQFGTRLLKTTVFLLGLFLSLTFPCPTIWNISIIFVLAGLIFL